MNLPPLNLSVTAVIEPDNTARTLQLARTLVPGLQSVCYLSDGSYADKYMQKKLEGNCGHAGVPLYEIQFEHSNKDSVRQALTELPAGTVTVTDGAAATLTLRSILWGYAERAKTRIDAAQA